MTDIYIKSCNRAAYLDRCIRSIKKYVSGHGAVIVLDDGTEEKYLEKIAAGHPDVDVRRSPFGAKKREFLKNNYTKDNELGRIVTSMGYDPCAFWVEEVEKDENDFVIITEEDTWFRGSVDIARVTKNMAENDAVIFKFWRGVKKDDAKENDVDIRVIFDDGFVMDYYTPVIKEIMDVYKIFIVAFSVYRKDYWLNSLDGMAHYMDEPFALNRALEYVMRHQSEGMPVKFCRSGGEIIHQSRSTTVRADSGGMGVRAKIDNRLYNDAVNEAWLAGDMDSMIGFPEEISDDDLAAVFRRSLGREDVDKWRAWRKSYDGMYEKIIETI